MSKKIRDYLFISFIVIFLVMTIGVSLYASGYKFNFSWPLKFNRLLQKTGMLVVATQPAGATIYLNDKPQKESVLKIWKQDYRVTPTKLKNLLPGEYELRLEQAGYWPFKQKLRINSGETTFVEDINLFRENTPLMILASVENKLIISPDNKYLYAAGAKKIITLKTETSRSLNLNADTYGVWLSDNKLLAGGIIFDPIKESGDLNYASLIGASATNWYFDASGGQLYYQNNNSINRLGTNSKTTTLLLSGDNYLDYLPRPDNLFTLTKHNNQAQLNSYSQKNLQLISTWTLPANGEYSFVKDINIRLAVFDNKNKTLYLFNESDLSAGPIVIRNIKNWAVVNNQSLIYTNDFEIYVFNLANSRVDLITRLSEEINSIIWNDSGNYLIFSSPTTLNVLDFKNRNATLLFRAEKIAFPALDTKNDNLYFWAKIGQQEGIYKMLMQ